MTEATILVPTYNHGETLLYSVRSAFAQTVQDIEILIVGDGISSEGRQAAQVLQKEDPRVKFFDNPKGERHGEVHRHEALKGAKGKIVCYLCDDDLWMPDHIEVMVKALKDHDFAHALPIGVHTDWSIGIWRCDLSFDYFKDFIIKEGNRIPLSCGGHTLELYRKLREGWSPAPEAIFSDLFMWRKLLSHPDVRLKSTMRPTVVHFPASYRASFGSLMRVAELREWSKKLKTHKESFLCDVIAALNYHWVMGHN